MTERFMLRSVPDAGPVSSISSAGKVVSTWIGAGMPFGKRDR